MKKREQAAHSHRMSSASRTTAELMSCPACKGAGAQLGKKWCHVCEGTGYLDALESEAEEALEPAGSY